MGEREDEDSARARTLAHMRQLMAAATVLGVANGALACAKKDGAADAGAEAGTPFGPPDPSTVLTAPDACKLQPAVHRRCEGP